MQSTHRFFAINQIIIIDILDASVSDGSNESFFKVLKNSRQLVRKYYFGTCANFYTMSALSLSYMQFSSFFFMGSWSLIYWYLKHDFAPILFNSLQYLSYECYIPYLRNSDKNIYNFSYFYK